MPGRTRSKCAAGRVRVAAELARCRSGGSTPSRRAAATASVNAATWPAMVGCPGASAYAKWLQTPTTSTSSAAAALAAAVTSSGQSAAVAPPRDSPVSTLRCTRARWPASRAAATTSASAHGALTERSTSAATPAARSSPGTASQDSTGARMPAARSAIASSRKATPSQPAPPASAARAAGTRPCPYPSALTTAITSAEVPARSRATLRRIAPRSMIASDRSMRSVSQS